VAQRLICACGVIAYLNEETTHKQEGLDITRNMAETIEGLIKEDPEGFAGYVVFYKAHCDDMILKDVMQITEKSTDENLPIWERISAAAGKALFNPEIDQNIDNVFKRADNAMYENKTFLYCISILFIPCLSIILISSFRL